MNVHVVAAVCRESRSWGAAVGSCCGGESGLAPCTKSASSRASASGSVRPAWSQLHRTPLAVPSFVVILMLSVLMLRWMIDDVAQTQECAG